MSNRSTIFSGLFVMIFGLYAYELKKHVPDSEKPRSVLGFIAKKEIEAPPRQGPRIEVAYDKLSKDPVFAGKFEGIYLIPAPVAGVEIGRDFMLVLQGDEVFASESASVRDGLHSVLDHAAEFLHSEPGMKVEISGFADENDLEEQGATDEGRSAYEFSYSRAEWVARYFERQHGFDIPNTFILRGMGPSPKGKRVELRFYFNP